MSHPTKLIKVLTPIALAISLAACGGGGDSFGDKSGGTGGGGDDGTGTEVPLVYNLGQMDIGLASLSAGGSTGITVELKDQHGDFAKTPQTMTFTSSCISNGTSEIDSPITSSTGVFTTTYTAKGCEGADVIKAEVGALDSIGTINVEPANLGQVEFIGAEPKNILLKGMSAAGLQHTSTVTFQIKNDVGGPLANTDVSFELVTPGVGDGGITLSSAVGKTNNEGFVSTILEAGTVHTTVRVRATVVRGGITSSSESSALSISTGVADQNSLSLSLSTLNPAAWDHDNVEVDVNIIASDRYNGPVPDGTAVAFYTELGQMNPSSCETVAGKCSVKWVSSDPRDLGTNDIRYPHEGITTITAKVIGEESFLDTNANGIFDDGDVFDTLSDKGEAYTDYNKGYTASVGYDDGLDRFILDYNGNGVHDNKDNLYTGLNCQHSTLCATGNGLKDIFTSTELVLAEDNQHFRIFNGNTVVVDSSISHFQTLTVGVNYRLEVFGVTNKQVPPEGTQITVSADGAKVLGGSLKVGSTNQHGDDASNPYGPAVITFALAEPTKNGSVDILVDTKKVSLKTTIGFSF